MHVAAQVVDDDLRALAREQQRVLAPESAAGARDDGDASLECTHVGLLLSGERNRIQSVTEVRGRAEVRDGPNVSVTVVVSSGTMAPGLGV